MVRVSVIYHRDRVIIGVNGRCRLCSSLTQRERVYENPDHFTQTREGYLLRQYQTSGGVKKSLVYYELGMRTGW